ncbi:dinitrogenase iron-molybdenum cofactor biosynthe sis protein [Desulfonema ishimotonii]|uniref:Dinitrogenase iron-molybdenum cofactor biosynthe sis protein n=1 Tax=Desulfonema ishimotonii TaxID=45657 RepID=A0A401FTU0_9BACT|nr:NifB/NifX family molybdenum-iron cluster-binding protein [Desulfonema ishimotonii]GBC60364.1 dinitrogenase iron-molybdenum cofactor biosynthe sis protein [Desulfonema ishimotonii]
MNIAITSVDRDLSSALDPRFGRAKYFIIVDSETMSYRVVENEQNLNLPQGAGIQAGKTIVENNVDVLITGNCGPKAFKVLESADIDVIIGAKGSVKDVVSQYKAGELQPTDNANVEGHWI